MHRITKNPTEHLQLLLPIGNQPQMLWINSECVGGDINITIQFKLW